jgi:hypothetical protein
MLPAVYAQGLMSGQGVAGINQDELRIAAPAQEGTDAVSDLPAAYAVAELIDLAGNLQSQNVRGTRRCGIEAHALQDVRPVDPGRVNADANLARSGDRIGAFGRNQ